MAAPRKLKKSESLEIRIPYPTKQAFMARCRAEGRSASEALRAFIEAHLEAPRLSRKTRAWRFAAGALAAAAMAAAAAPSLARVVQAEPHSQAEFLRLDVNQDGLLDYREYSRAH
jgi:hypothetical protein